MSRRPPWTLWKHICVDLWRMLLLTVAVLVTVIAFAAAVKPLADGKLGPAEAIKFMLLAVPPMLAYALPFSAGFAATLAYHRMSQDNELLAAHAGGVAHRSLLAPALATGAALFLTLAALNEYIIPRFLQSMERLVAQDLTKLMVNSIERGYAVEENGLMVLADGVTEPNDEQAAMLAAKGFVDAIELRAVVFIDTDGAGNVQNSVVAAGSEVYVSVLPDEGRTASIYLVEGWAKTETEKMKLDRSFALSLPIPDAFKDDPKFLTWGELRDLRDNPDRMDFVHTRSMELAYRMARRATTDTIDGDLRASGQTKLITSSGEFVVIRAGGIRWDRDAEEWIVVPLGGSDRIELEWWRSDETGVPGSLGITRMVADAATMRAVILQSGVERELTITLVLKQVRVANTGSLLESDPVSGSLRPEFPMQGLRLAYDPLEEFTAKSAYELLGEAEPRVNREVNPDNILAPATHELRREVDKLQREITSKQHERWALACSCLIMVVTGSIMAIKLREAQPLAVYLWSFFPALGSIITILGGQQFTHKSGDTGLVILWGGVAALGAYTFISFLSIRKH